MRIFPPPLDIQVDEGFSRGKDIFGRAYIGAGLTNLIASVTEPLVIAVDGQWGSGKTVFLKMWAGELRKEGFPVIYFDAFENDYLQDAFTAIASEILALAEEKRKLAEPTATRFVEKAVDTGKILLRSGLKVGVKAATLGALDFAELSQVAADIASEASHLTDMYLEKVLTDRQKQKDVYGSVFSFHARELFCVQAQF